jgi:hypothetical protein
MSQTVVQSGGSKRTPFLGNGVGSRMVTAPQLQYCVRVTGSMIICVKVKQTAV